MRRVEAFLVLILIPACALATGLKTTTVDDRKEIRGTVDLVLYGGRHSNDIETLAILDRTGDRFEFVPVAPEFDYKVKKGVPADKALQEAEEFVRQHRSVTQVYITKVLDREGNPLGYEVRPLYRPIDYGERDVMNVSYWIVDGTVKVRIWLKPEVERFLEGDDLRPRRGPR